MQSDQHICNSLPAKYDISSYFIDVISTFRPVSVVEQAGLNMTWFETPKTVFLTMRPIFKAIILIILSYTVILFLKYFYFEKVEKEMKIMHRLR